MVILIRNVYEPAEKGRRRTQMTWIYSGFCLCVKAFPGTHLSFPIFLNSASQLNNGSSGRDEGLCEQDTPHGGSKEASEQSLVSRQSQTFGKRE